jgi:hypothetical protein
MAKLSTNVKVWTTGREQRDSGAKQHSAHISRHPPSTTHALIRLINPVFSWDTQNIERGLKETVRKLTPLEDSRHYL